MTVSVPTSQRTAVVNLWDAHWAHYRPAALDQLDTPFARHAFAGLSRLMGNEATQILEVGCGTGRFCARLATARPHAQITGVDLAPASLAIARTLPATLGLPNLAFVDADMFDLPYPDAYFDAVFSEGVIQHFDTSNGSREALMREMRRVLKPGGELITSVVNWHCYPHTVYKFLLRVRKAAYEYGYEKSYTRRELSRYLSLNGFDVVDWCGYYPAHGFYRLAGYSRAFKWLGRIAEWAPPRATQAFGFEIWVKARKPTRGQ